MKNKERKLTLCRTGSERDLPYVLIKGRWFKRYGFSPGDRVIITNPEPHVLIMTVHKTAAEMQKERNKKKQEIDDFIKKALIRFSAVKKRKILRWRYIIAWKMYIDRLVLNSGLGLLREIRLGQ